MQMERLQKVIADAGYTSRRKAEVLILQGKVRVNGEVVKTLGTKVGPSDHVMVDGVSLEKQDKEYYLLYKPRGVVTTTSDDKGRKTVMDFIHSKNRLYPVGRLDYDTTGALIVTNDGDFANQMMHPSNHIEKVYIAKLEGIIKGEGIILLKKGVVLDGELVIPSRVKLRKVDKVHRTSIVEMSIFEGKNHQVKRMFEAVGYHVSKLRRERIAFLDLTGLQSGEYRRIKPHEIKMLYNLTLNK